MKRPVIVVVGVAALVAAAALVWVEVRREREFRRLVAVGEHALAANAASRAIEAFSGALAFKPDAMLAHLKRGEAYLRRSELDAALRDLREASRLDPTAPLPLERLGDVHAAMRAHALASGYYESSLALDDRAPRVLYKLGQARYAGGRAKDAIEPLQRAVALEGGRAEAHYQLGAALRAAGRAADALRPLRRAIELRPRFTAARGELASAYAQLGRTRDSLEELEASAALDTTRPEPLVVLAAAYARLGRRDAAAVTLNRAIERYPGSLLARTALGRLWLESAEAGGDRASLDRALSALRPLAERSDAGGEALTLYGRALMLSGALGPAERVLQQAVERLPVRPVAFRHLADVALRLGHQPIARDALARYAALHEPAAGGR